jgi:hypothetical protein
VQNYAPRHAELVMLAGASTKECDVDEGGCDLRGYTCLARSNSPEVAHSVHVESIILSPGEFNALRLMIIAMMAVPLLYWGVAELYWSMFGIGYGPF